MEELIQIFLTTLAGFFFLTAVFEFICVSTKRQLVCNHRTQKLLLFLFVLTLTLMAFIWMPQNNDLTRHMHNLDIIRNSDNTLPEFLHETSLKDHNYKYLLIFNIYRYILARLFENNHMLPAVTVFIMYSIWAYIAYDSRKKKQTCFNLLTLTMSFSFMPFIFSNSGIRNGLAASLSALGAYLYLKKEKSLFLVSLLWSISLFIHPVSALIIPFVFLSKFDLKWFGYILVFFISFLAPKLSVIFSHLNIPFLQFISIRFNSYTSATQYRGSKFYLYGDFILMACIIIAWLMINKKKLKANTFSQYSLCYCQILYIIFVFGFIGNYDMVLRPMYTIGILAPSLSYLFNPEYWKKKYEIIRLVLVYICILIGFYMIWMYMNEYFKCQIWYFP